LHCLCLLAESYETIRQSIIGTCGQELQVVQLDLTDVQEHIRGLREIIILYRKDVEEHFREDTFEKLYE